jgi:hypothetical protein
MMKNAMKTVALLAQLVLASHGDVHPIHEEHAHDIRKIQVAIAR